MPHVLVLFEYPSLNGGERSLLSVSDLVVAAGFQLTALAQSVGPLAAELARCDVRHVPFDFFADDGRRLERYKLRSQLGAALEAEQPDLFHANSLAAARLSGPVVRGLNVPSIGHLRDILRLNRAAIADLNCHSRLLAVSQATLDYHVALGLNTQHTFVAYNGVDTCEFRQRVGNGFLHREIGLPATARLIGSIGQIGLRKGLDSTLTAAPAIVAAEMDAHFLVIGERFSRKDENLVHEQQLRSMANQNPLDGHVHFLGTRNDVSQLLPELSLLVHAARQEPLGRVLLEAGACGLPIVSTDVGGTREIFPEDQSAAVLVAADDPPAIAEAAIRILGDASLARRLGQGARERIAMHFNHEVAAETLLGHYRDVIANGTP